MLRPEQTSAFRSKGQLEGDLFIPNAMLPQPN